MKDTINNLKTLLSCKTVDDLALILGVNKTTIYRAKKGSASENFTHSCQIMEIVLKELPKEKLQNCSETLHLFFGKD